MDPYLESPAIWPDFHDAFAGEIRRELNRTLPAPYYARLEMRPEIGVVAGGAIPRRIVPDVSVVGPPRDLPVERRTAILDRPRTEISSSYELSVHDESLRHQFIEIRDPTQGHKLVTLIEIASPSNKLGGPDREAYLRKQHEVLESDASLVEIDLLRAGERLASRPSVLEFLRNLEPPPRYVVLVHRAWRRAADRIGYQLFAVGVRDTLPCVPIPLREEDPEVPLDLQFVFNRAYDSGPYARGAVDYTRPCDPPLSEDDASWAAEVLRAATAGGRETPEGRHP